MNHQPGTMSPTRLRRARAAVIAAFTLNGILIAMWAVSIPTAEHQTGIDHGVLGSLQITEHLQVPDSLGALGYAFFAIAMTIGRLRAYRVTAAIGPRRLVRYGAVVAAAGLLIIILSGQLWLTFAGWALLGIGLSGSVPQILTAAGSITSGNREPMSPGW